MPECAPLGWLVTRDWFNREEFADVYAISMLFTSAHSLMYEKGRDVAMSRTRARMSFMTRLELEATARYVAAEAFTSTTKHAKASAAPAAHQCQPLDAYRTALSGLPPAPPGQCRLLRDVVTCRA